MSFLSGLGLPQLLTLRLVLAVGMASLGALIASGAKKINHHGLCLLISFAAGALLAVALFDILPEAAAMSGLLPALVSALTGYLLFWGITKFVFHVCPACAATHTEANFTAITLAMVVALSIHSFMDGLAIYAGLKAGSQLGLLILFAVAYHKLPEGMALTLVAVGSGRRRVESFFLTLALEASTTIGGGLAGLVSAIPAESPWIGLLLGHVAGGFVYLVGHALLSEVVKDHPRSTLLAAFMGGASMALITAFLGVH